jgi:hypothetical protein
MLRIFSKNNDISFNDYIKNIKGKTILSNLKTNNHNNNNYTINNNKIVSYLSYNDFLIVTQTFYKFSNLKKNYKPPQKIIDLKTSFIFYNKYLNHIQRCDLCKTNNVDTNFVDCKEIKNILYPYGENFAYEIYSKLSSVDLDNWCSKECIQNIYCHNDSNPSNDLSKYYYSETLSEVSSSEVTSGITSEVTSEVSLNRDKINDENNSVYSNNSELQKLKFYSEENLPYQSSEHSSYQSSELSKHYSENLDDYSSISSKKSLNNQPINHPNNNIPNICLKYEETPQVIPTNINMDNLHNKLNNIYINDAKNNIRLINPIGYEINNKIEIIPNYEFANNIFNIFIAELTNSKEYAFHKKTAENDIKTDIKNYNTYNFIPIYIHFEEFKNIFFNSNTKYFNISDVISNKIKLSNQNYVNVNNEIEPFVISNSIKKIYIEKNNFNEVDTHKLNEIEKETNDFVSLYDFNYIANSLNLDEIIDIINNNNIDISSEIKFKMKVCYKSKITDIPCIMYFNYIIKNIKSKYYMKVK